MGRRLSSFGKTVLFICAFAPILPSALGASDGEWKTFKLQYGKTYENAVEEAFRRSVWEDNLKFIERHNAKGEHTFSLGVNEFADWTHSEFMQTMNGVLKQWSSETNPIVEEPESNKTRPPGHVDWRDRGYVTPVKHQGECGSCWAFSTTGSLEGQLFKATGQLVSLSEQQLVDCSWKFGNRGCEGGWPRKAMKYIKKNGGIDTEKYYPYEERRGLCRYKPRYKAVKVRGIRRVTPRNERALKRKVAKVGPISVSIDARDTKFRFYHKGVYDNPKCSSSLATHSVLVVGYGSSGNQEYWIVKNSWGEDWGEKGYVRMSRNKRNQCGIASYGVWPLV